ncbi:Fur family transcriptional regulator [Bosea sp. MMO-172]|uniref:Fur family transcriptional regulator n=1 Tax=Bosea sp. MMO-172 TaxID=3127885 RepID=UPI003017585A
MTTHVDALIARYRNSGRRVTGPRRVIAEVVAHATDHPDISELYRRVAEIDPRISLSTVYRTLKVFAAKGLVERHSFAGGRVQIEPAAERHHDHLINVDTGEVVEFRSDAIERLQAEVAKQLGFELTGHKLVLYGRRTARPDG